jgi:biuret amidohydrolase
MKNISGISIPQTLEEVCDPQRVALLVYDMQVGILNQIKNPEQITLQVLKVLSAPATLEFASCFRGIFHCQKN